MHHNIEIEGATGLGNHIQTFHTAVPVMGTQYPPFQTGPLGIQYQPFQSVNPGMLGTAVVPAIGTDIQPLQIKSDSSRILSDFCHVVEIPDSIGNCVDNNDCHSSSTIRLLKCYDEALYDPTLLKGNC